MTFRSHWVSCACLGFHTGWDAVVFWELTPKIPPLGFKEILTPTSRKRPRVSSVKTACVVVDVNGGWVALDALASINVVLDALLGSGAGQGRCVVACTGTRRSSSCFHAGHMDDVGPASHWTRQDWLTTLRTSLVLRQEHWLCHASCLCAYSATVAATQRQPRRWRLTRDASIVKQAWTHAALTCTGLRRTTQSKAHADCVDCTHTRTCVRSCAHVCVRVCMRVEWALSSFFYSPQVPDTWRWLTLNATGSHASPPEATCPRHRKWSAHARSDFCRIFFVISAGLHNQAKVTSRSENRKGPAEVKSTTGTHRRWRHWEIEGTHQRINVAEISRAWTDDCDVNILALTLWRHTRGIPFTSTSYLTLTHDRVLKQRTQYGHSDWRIFLSRSDKTSDAMSAAPEEEVTSHVVTSRSRDTSRSRERPRSTYSTLTSTDLDFYSAEEDFDHVSTQRSTSFTTS